MCVGEQDTLLRQSIEIGRQRLWVASHTTDPVVQIIQCNEENVGAFGFFVSCLYSQGEKIQNTYAQ